MGSEHDTLDSVSVEGADRNRSSVGITDGRRLTHIVGEADTPVCKSGVE